MSIPSNVRVLSEHESTRGAIGYRTSIWTCPDGTVGAEVVEAAEDGELLRFHVEGIASLSELDALLLAEVPSRGHSDRLGLLHSAAGAYERATWVAAA